MGPRSAEEPSPAAEPRGPARFLLPLALVLVTLAVFAQVARFDFVDYDDADYILENPYVLEGLSGPSLTWAMTTFQEANWHPLTWISFMVDAEIGGTNPRVYHLTNLAFHLADTLLLFYA